MIEIEMQSAEYFSDNDPIFGWHIHTHQQHRRTKIHAHNLCENQHNDVRRFTRRYFVEKLQSQNKNNEQSSSSRFKWNRSLPSLMWAEDHESMWRQCSQLRRTTHVDSRRPHPFPGHTNGRQFRCHASPDPFCPPDRIWCWWCKWIFSTRNTNWRNVRAHWNISPATWVPIVDALAYYAFHGLREIVDATILQPHRFPIATVQYLADNGK